LREASRAPKASARTKAVLRQRTLDRGCKIPLWNLRLLYRRT
jgi:hypothetical protein